MKAEQIEHVDFASPDLDFATGELADKAAKILGYQRSSSNIKGSLLQALRKLEIIPLLASSVKKYQKSKERTGWYSGTKEVMWWTVSVVVAWIIGPYIGYHADWKAPNIPSVLSTCFFIWAIGGTLILFFARAFNELPIGEGKRTIREWQTVSLNGYNGLVPDHVLLKAIEIKTEFPDVKLEVEYLTDRTQSYHRPLPDPFLVARHNSEIIYIDVWDERDYEKTL